jgi:hypothetical protein
MASQMDCFGATGLWKDRAQKYWVIELSSILGDAEPIPDNPVVVCVMTTGLET